MLSSKALYKEYRKFRGFFGQKNRNKKDDGSYMPHGGFGHRHHGGGPVDMTKGKQPLIYYLKRYAQSMSEHKKYIFTLLFIGHITLILRAVNPWTSKFMLDYVFSDKPVPFIQDYIRNLDKVHLLMWACIILGVISLSELALSAINELIARVLSLKMEIGIRRKLIRHMQVMPLNKLEKLKTGGIISRIEGDVNSYSALLYEGLMTPLEGITMFVFGLVSLLFISKTVTCICLVFIIVLSCVAFVIFNIMRPLFRDMFEDNSKISGRLAETFGGIRVVRIFGREARETANFVGSHHLLIRKALHTTKLHISVHRVVQFINICMDVSMWAVGGYYLIKGRITIGDLMVFTRFTNWFFHPVFMIMYSLSHVQGSVACTERIYDMLDEEIATVDKPNAVDVSQIQSDLELSHVNFQYDEGKPVLEDLSLKVPAGKTMALVGASGAGKSTITNLLVRFYEPQSGQILLDGQDIRDFSLRSYRSLFSFVLQDVFLFDGTIAENISYSKPDATEDEIIAAAKIAAADEFIQQFPDKYDTMIGERGVRLSGGQKQRISLARAILKNPQILILDEATSSLDSQSEALIQEALKTILKGRTTIIIAHRLSTILDADCIAVVDEGKVVEQGTHAELLAKNGKYAEMYRKQMEKTSVDPHQVFWKEEDK